MRTSLDLFPWQILDDRGIDDAVDLSYEVLYAAIKDCTPSVQINRHYPPWFDRELRRAYFNGRNLTAGAA